MNRQSRVTTTFIASGVIALYIETVLQIYVIVTAQETPLRHTPAAMVALALVATSFLVSSLASAFLARRTMRSDDERCMGKAAFRCLHIACLGLPWRIGKLLIGSSSSSDTKDLTAIRLIHVALQSCPFIVICSTTFISAGKINVIQVFSLMASVMSTVLAIASYNLRKKLFNDPVLEEETGTRKLLGLWRPYVAISLTSVGTFLILSIRLISMSLMASQEPHWIFLPLGCHFLVLLVVFIGFSSRTKSGTAKVLPQDIFMHCVWGTGMSILNCFELVHDKIERLMCKYVGFYSLFLLENIVFLSFWLLRFDMDYAAKLMSVVGILIGFILGLFAKFAGFSVIQQNRPTVDSRSPTAVLTFTNTSTGMSQTLSSNIADDDLVSIVQASMSKQSIPPGSPQPRELSSRKMKGEKSGNCISDQCAHGQINRGFYEGAQDISSSNRNEGTCSHLNMPLNIISQANISSGERHRKESDNKSSDLDNSFQPDSMFNVSDPGTIRSDMMYDKDLEEHNFESLNATSLRLSIHSNSYQSPLPGYSKNKHVLSKRPQHSDKSAFEPRYKERHRNNQSSGEKADNQNTISSQTEGTKKSRTLLQSQQPNEFSDTALSSAKTFPIESKKSDFKTYDSSLLSKSNLGRKMNKIIYSLEDRDRSRLKVDNQVRYLPNSDDDVLRYKLSGGSFQTARNRISYTEPEEISSSEYVISGQGSSTKIRLSDRNKKPTKLPKHNSQRTARASSNQAIVLTPSTLQAFRSESSSFSSQTLENQAYTKTSTSSSSTFGSVRDPYWDVAGQRSRKEILLPDEDDQMTSSESILRWLASTEEPEQEAQV